MNEAHIGKIAQELAIRPQQVAATGRLLDDSATVPFIARYRKEVTGGLDEVAIAAVRDRFQALAALDQRREAILKSLDERSLLTDKLKAAVLGARTMTALEDVYQPYRPKRRTRATVAKEQGLEPLAERIFKGQDTVCPQTEARAFVSEEKGVASVEAALAGARDIIAEWVADDAVARGRLRDLMGRTGVVSSKVVKGKEETGQKFKDYFDWSEAVGTIPSHRILAMRRGESEGVLLTRVAVPEDDVLAVLEPLFVTARGAAAAEVKSAVKEGHKRLLGPSMEVEVRLRLKKQADADAIAVFADNLRELLLTSPLGQKAVLAMDPGFRSGCKVVCLDPQGKLLHHDVIYPTMSEKQAQGAATAVRDLCKRFAIEAIAIGNGTASRETEAFVRGLKFGTAVEVVVVNESGASIYSASDVAREEFPDHDVTVRGSVSIGRRLMDPLAELVKLDAKSIGVGQYQHDVDQRALKQSLDEVVGSCVNRVGVELNTASRHLLSYVSGLGPQLAGNIVAYRDENGPFASRAALKKVPRLGPKAFEQAAGFLRIRDGGQPLDTSAVHPERYGLVKTMAGDLGCTVPELMRDGSLRQRLVLQSYVAEGVGLPTLQDILEELAKPGRDPRARFESFAFQEGIEKLADLKPGMRLPGLATNVTKFGAFVDVGVHQDGLVHISQLADRFVSDPAQVVKVQQRVMVTVVEVDVARKRIGLSMRTAPEKTTGGEKPVRAEAPRTRQGKNAPKRKAKEAPPGNNWFSEAMDWAGKRG